eukprot:TRINITY_DN3879_c0_g2_i1.p1 TRINITY_DN3879_c0_g2~~TRINITY_DN3879_c0_g2_i1.p1  ORF type:complete len:167 (-),score=21.89 TRINITY_DN3879_c0_g2_i1:310-810(-)
MDSVTTYENFFFCATEDMIRIASAAEGIDGLSMLEKHTIVTAPVNADVAPELAAFLGFVRMYAAGENVRLGGLPTSIMMALKTTKTAAVLSQLELFYRILDAYLWLSMRFEGFVSYDRAVELQVLIEEKIYEHLSSTAKATYGKQRKARQIKRKKFAKKESFARSS